MRRFFLILIACCAIISLVQPFIRSQVHYHNLDVAFNYHMATLMTDGQIPYRDFIDFNFPTIWYISYIPAYISYFIHHDAIVLSLFLGGLTLISAIVCAFLIVKCTLFSLMEQSLLCITLFFVFSTFQTYDFGQREHLFILAYIPFLIRQYLVPNLNKYKILDCFIGFLTITGAFIKPYFILTLLCVELSAYSRNRSLNYTQGMRLGFLIGVIFWAGIFIYHVPEYLVIAEYAAKTYAGQNTMIGINPISVILEHKLSLLVYAALCVYALFYKKKDSLFLLHTVCTTASVMSFLSALIQMKGFDYHIKIAASFSVISLSLGFMRFVPIYIHNKSIQKNFYIILCSAIVLRQCYTCTTLTESYAQNYSPTRVSKNTDSLLSEHNNAKTIFKISTFSQPLYPAIIKHPMRDITGCNTLWYLGSFYRNQQSSADTFTYHSVNTMQPLERYFFHKVTQSLIQEKPDIIIIADSNYNYFFSVSGFDIKKYYAQDHFFSTMLSEEYRSIAHTDGHTWYKKRSLR